ncbi:MAG: hypothetical protein Q4F95_02650 [Oscillospiraceae bacterium]|nr:hypothetical protein [Oscillospiraceae bacterium]
MSYFKYIAADTPLDELTNPYVRYYSVSQARQAGIELDYELLSSTDPDKENTVVWCESEDKLNFPCVYAVKKEDFTQDIGTRRTYCAVLECGDLKKYAGEVLNYIKKELVKMNEIELWCIDLGLRDRGKEVRTDHIKADNLCQEHIMKALYLNTDTPYCLIIRKDVN